MSAFIRIQHKALSKSALKIHLEIIQDGANTLQKWHVLAKEKNKRLGRLKFLKEINQKGIPCNIYGLRIPKADIEKINKIQDSKMPVIQHHARFIELNARKWAKVLQGNTNSFDFEDFYGEAFLAANQAIYYYNKPFKFITYLGNVILRQLSRAVNQSSALSHLSNRTIRILVKYNRYKLSHPHASFDEAVEALQLNQKEIQSLSGALTTVIKETDGIATIQIPEDQDNPMLMANQPGRPEVKLDLDEQEAIKQANLTEWERAVLAAFLKGGYAWQTEVAAKSFNPHTGKPYTRQFVGPTMDTIRQKVQDAYGRKVA